MPEPVEVRKVPILNVSDASGLADLVDRGVLDADRVVAVIGKTEGNGGVNDYTRIIADRAFREVLVAKGTRSAEEVNQVPIVWSGSSFSLIAKPTVSRGSSVAGAAPAGTVAKIVACGLSTPSVPPDHTIGTWFTSSALRVPLATSTSRNARSAMIRV